MITVSLSSLLFALFFCRLVREQHMLAKWKAEEERINANIHKLFIN